MSISFNAQKSAYFPTALEENVNRQAQSRQREIKRLLKSLDTPALDNPFQVMPQDKVNGFLKSSGSPDSANEPESTRSDYKYKEISSKIQQAKTSTRAGQALIAAKRTVMDIKRKLYSGKGDSEELQIALTHAKRMEMVARKKKHHLELEEMVMRTQKRDEEAEEFEDASKAAEDLAITQAEEKIYDEEDAIFEQRSEMMEESIRSLYEEYGDLSNVSEETMSEINQMIAEFGEEELEILEENMEMLENLEVINPHMDEDDFKKLVTKHRNSEQKAIAKADMDYLKDMIKHVMNTNTPAISVAQPMSGATLQTPGFSITI